MRMILLAPILVFGAFAVFGVQAVALSTIPFVGCASDDSIDHYFSPPSRNPVQIDLPPNIAAKLALYADDYAILGPRGWECDGDRASTVVLLDLYPARTSQSYQPIGIDISNNSETTGFRKAIQISGRYFPKSVSKSDLKNFVEDWFGDDVSVAQIIVPSYPTDRITYLSPAALAFETPPGKPGIMNGIGGGQPSPIKISGIISVNFATNDREDNSSYSFINVSLPPNLDYLTPYILEASKACVLRNDHASCTMQDGVIDPYQ